MHSFEVHLNESACRKNGRLGLEQVIITPLTCNIETAVSVIDGSGDAVHWTSDLMGTLGVDLGAGESSNNTADPVSGAAEGESSTSITPFSDALRE